MPSARSIAVRICLGIVLGAGAMPSGAAAEAIAGIDGTPPLQVFTARQTGVATMAWSATQDRDGRMYFGCDTVVSFDGDRWRPAVMDPTDLVRGLDAGPNGRIWAAAENQIGWFDPGPQASLTYHSLMNRLPADAADLGDVWRAYAQGPDAAVFVSWNRVLRWDGNAVASWNLPGMQHLLWSTRTSKAIYVDYPPSGIMKVTDGGPIVAIPASVVGPAPVGWLDDTGPDWLLMTSQGFKRVHGDTCALLDSPASAFVRANTATSAVRLRDGTLAVGTLKGGIALVSASGEILRTFNALTGLPSNQVYGLFVDREGALWGMGPAHIFRLGLGSGTALYSQRNGYPSGGSDSITNAGGSLFIAAHGEVLRLEPDVNSGGAGEFRTFGPPSGRLYSLMAVPHGLAVGHLHGLGLWSHDAVRSLGSLDESAFRINPSHVRPGRILASLAGRVVSVDPATGESVVVADALPDYGDTVVDDASGRVWVGTGSRGLLVAEPGRPHAVPAASRFGAVPATGPAFVALAGSTVVALAGNGAFYLDAHAQRFREVAGFPGGAPSAVSNADSSGAVWAALYPEVGAHGPKLGKITVGQSGASWSPRSIEGLSTAGTVLGLCVVPSRQGDALWMSGTEALLRADSIALARPQPPPKPRIRAWVAAEGTSDGAPAAGTLPYSTRSVHIEYSSADFGMRGSERYQTLLGGAEIQWSPPTDSAERDISGLRDGSYDFRVRLVTDSGEAGEAAVLAFAIAPPWWRTPLARAALAAMAVLAIFIVLKLRTRALRRRAELLEKMVRQRTEELEKANAAKTDFVTSMSHEIRNPMGGILASALELSETPLEPGQQKLVTTLQSCASYLASLVEDVLDFAAIETGAYTVTRSGFSPREVLETVIKMLGTRAAPGAMSVAIDPGIPERLIGDAGRIQQVIVNFAANSLKFGAQHVWLSARADADFVVYSVADDGIGVPADEQKNLFIRFSRLKSARNSAIPGTGLGLAVCRALAERMGGTVGFAPAPGGGSIFLLRLPIEACEADSLPTPSYEARGLRALVVEDIDYNARALALMLGRLGFEVSTAADGGAALGLLTSRHFDAIFLDCDLPQFGGIEVARRFRKTEFRGKRARIVATTALSTVADREACFAAGMDAFLSKPITPQKLLGILTQTEGLAADPAGIETASGPTPGLDLGMIAHLADGSAGSFGRELEKYFRSLDEALAGVPAARNSDSRAAVATAAHRVLSLARMVGADSLSSTAADIQDYASAFTDAELADEIEILVERGRALRNDLESLAQESPLSSSRGA